MNCRFCKTTLQHKVIDLESCPPANAYLTNLATAEIYYPLQVYVCNNCFLVQTLDYVRPADIFNKNYAFISSASDTWKQHCEDYAASIIRKLRLNEKSKVVEIGSNDGILLKCFAAKGMHVSGIDPAASPASYTTAGLELTDDFFTHSLAVKLAARQQADLVIANNVIAHVPDVNDFVSGVAALLQPAGVATIELPHLVNLVKYSQFDTIYHEHFSYFSLTTLQTIFQHHGLRIFDVEKLPIHGGSLRVYITHADDQTNTTGNTVEDILREERELGITNLDYYSGLQDAAFRIKTGFLSWLMKEFAGGKKIMAYGAAAKGNTLLNYCGIKKDIIPFIADITLQKQGKFLPGSHLQVLDESYISQYRPDYIIVLPWNYKTEIDKRLEYTRNWGCRLVYLIPELKVE